jgi:hypothetical protein
MDKQGTCGFGEFLKVKSKCKNGKKPVPLNKRLYNSRKSKIKAKEEWPSRYASLHLVKNYKKAKGKFKCAFGNNGNFETFYKDGTPNSLNLTNKIRNCQSLVYGNLNRKNSFGVIGHHEIAIKLQQLRKLNLSQLKENYNYNQQRYGRMIGKVDEEYADDFKTLMIDTMEQVIKEKTVRNLTNRELTGKWKFGRVARFRARKCELNNINNVIKYLHRL